MPNDTSRRAVVRCPFCATLNRVDFERLDHHPKCAECEKPILLDRPIAIAGGDLDRVVGESDVPVLVDFYADWCGPCKAMAPLLDELARAQRGRALIAKLDTDRSPEVTQRFNVRGIPTLIVFRDGREVARETGAVPRQRLETLLDLANGGGHRQAH